MLQLLIGSLIIFIILAICWLIGYLSYKLDWTWLPYSDHIDIDDLIETIFTGIANLFTILIYIVIVGSLFVSAYLLGGLII